MTGEALRSSLERLPLFPLPGGVLLPGARLPLHIFEPRYRTMIQDAVEQELPIAIGLMNDETTTNSLGLPMVQPVVGVGQLENVRRLPDGRYILDLVGQMRVRIVDEAHSGKPYRIVRGMEILDAPASTERAVDAVEMLRRLVFGVHQAFPRAAGRVLDVIEKADSPLAVADDVAALLSLETPFRQHLLELDDPLLRLDAVTERIGRMLAEAIPDEKKQMN